MNIFKSIKISLSLVKKMPQASIGLTDLTVVNKKSFGVTSAVKSSDYKIPQGKNTYTHRVPAIAQLSSFFKILAATFRYGPITVEQAARIAAHVYNDKADSILSGGLEVSKRVFNDVQLMNYDNGLNSKVYERTSNHITEYVYAIAGTEIGNAEDARQDIAQLIGRSTQYALSIKNAIKINEQLGAGTALTFVGHSLGGGQAAACAYATGRYAITFNAAGLSGMTIRKYKLNEKLKVVQIDAYILKMGYLKLTTFLNP